jgi:hypothetical protein
MATFITTAAETLNSTNPNNLPGISFPNTHTLTYIYSYITLQCLLQMHMHCVKYVLCNAHNLLGRYLIGIQRVLRTVYSTQNHWVSGLRPSLGLLYNCKPQRFGNRSRIQKPSYSDRYLIIHPQCQSHDIYVFENLTKYFIVNSIIYIYTAC